MVALRNVRAFGESGASLEGLVISYLKVACDVCKDTDLEDISKRSWSYTYNLAEATAG